jgi:hypothetical protein
MNEDYTITTIIIKLNILTVLLIRTYYSLFLCIAVFVFESVSTFDIF